MALTAGLFLFESLLGLLSLGSSRQLLEPIRDEQV